METKNDHISAYECLSSIGNSLDLHKMLTEVLTTFIRCTQALGGKFIENDLNTYSQLTIGKELPPFAVASSEDKAFFIHETGEEKVLQIPLNGGNIFLLFDAECELEKSAIMLSNLSVKLSNAINACRNVKKLHRLNANLAHQIDIEKHKNEATEKLMISQSRLAIMGEMIGMIAHQWRQPITIIGMLTNNTLLDIQFGELKQDQLANDLESIDKQIHFLSRTIDDFRNFFRPNKLPQTMTFSDIQNELTTIIGKSFENNQIALVFEGDNNLSFITYQNELLQVFLNILNNAKDAFIEHKIISPILRFRLQENTTSLQFLITDNAGGMPSGILNRIFEPYFSTKSEKNGTGLGLYMSSIIVEKHLNGSIFACSEGESSTFSITLPKSSDSKGYNVY